MKNYKILISLLLLHLPGLYPVAGGLALYRFTKNNGLEFLMIKDPGQRKAWRQGFEFPAGVIGDYGHRTIDEIDGKKINRLSFSEKKDIPVDHYLRGCIREGLEELVFVPASYLVKGEPYINNKTIDQEFENKAITTVAQDIKKQDLLYLHKLTKRSNYTIFFWNVTNLPTKNLLRKIQTKRNVLLDGWFNRATAIGAEPDQFAWVSAQELQKVISQAKNNKDHRNAPQSYSVIATELVQDNLPLQRNVPIKLSPGLVGLISYTAQDSQKTSDMSSILRLLQP